MKFFFLIIFIFNLILLANNDSDFDGVEDSIDKCPNTTFTDIVDINGCTVRSLKEKLKHNFTTSFEYIEKNKYFGDSKTFVESFQYSYKLNKNILFNTSISYYEYSYNNLTKNGMLDTYIGISYKYIYNDKINLIYSIGIYLPTYKEDKNNKTDLKNSISYSYKITNNIDFFSSASYTIINDKNTIEQKYNNTYSFLLGTGYYLNNNIYIDIYYLNSSSVYNLDVNTETLNLSCFYTFNSNTYIELKYGKGINLNSIDNSFLINFNFQF